MTTSEPIMFCSFCGVVADDCGHLFSGPSVSICSDCVILALRTFLSGWPSPDPAQEQAIQAAKDAERSKPWIELRRTKPLDHDEVD